MVDVVLTIAKEFSQYPGPRFERDGPHSGEVFRDKVLVPALERAERTGDRLVIDLDGVRGYTASFLEEAFGGLIRVRGFSKDRLGKLLELRAKDRRVAYWCDRVKQYIESASEVSRKLG